MHPFEFLDRPLWSEVFLSSLDQMSMNCYVAFHIEVLYLMQVRKYVEVLN